MKTSQMLGIFLTFVIAIGLVTWLANSAPSWSETVESVIPKNKEAKNEIEDIARTNPFEITESGPQPKAIAEEILYEFGKMTFGKEGDHHFVLKNEGEVPLKIARGPSQCKCTVSGLATDEIPPGGEAKIQLKWRPNDVGPFEQEAVIWTNDPENPQFNFQVAGDVLPEVAIEPANGWVLGITPRSDERKFSGRLFSAIDETFQITDLKCSTDSLEASFRKMTEQELRDSEALQGYVVEGVLKPSKDVGKFRGQIDVTTDLETYKTIHFHVSANRTGPVLFVGKNWYAGQQLFQLGEVQRSKGKSDKLIMMIDRFDEDFKVESVTTDPEFLKVETKTDSSSNSKKDRVIVDIEVPPDSPLGTWKSGGEALVTLKTNHPELPEIAFVVEMEIVRGDN